MVRKCRGLEVERDEQGGKKREDKKLGAWDTGILDEESWLSY
jgi:hypothetical protein